MSFIMYYYSSPCVSSLLFNLYSIIIILFSSFSPKKIILKFIMDVESLFL
jgi:hypothetical protein